MKLPLKRRSLLKLSGGALALSAPRLSFAQPAKTVRAVMHAPLQVSDPIFSTAWTARNHGYNIYDTLFSIDSKYEIKPQMVDSFDVSADKLAYTFHLRSGLKFHDGAPVTSADVLASLQRWAKRDSMGQKLMEFVAEMVPVDERTFRMALHEPCGFLLQALGKPNANVPFIMPARVAMTPADQAVNDYVGSGPFRFVASEFQPNLKAVYERNPDYVSRDEPSDGMSGGRVVRINRYEWINIPDLQTATNALTNNEIDYVEVPPHDLIPILKQAAGVELTDYNETGYQGTCRLNWLAPPFDKPEIRQAVLHAVNQQDWLDVQVGNPDYYQVTPAMFVAGTPFASDTGWSTKADLALAKDLLKKGGYNNEPVVILQPSGIPVLTPVATVTAQALRALGMNVQLLTMDWGSVLARRAKTSLPAEGGWSIFHSVWAGSDMMNPLGNAYVNGKGTNGGTFGWSADAPIEKLRDDFARTGAPGEQKKIATDIQARAYDVVTYIPTGQYKQPAAHRKTLTGILKAPVPLFWNVDKTG
jgi:peptide/nickel transport system substrate-binding protein